MKIACIVVHILLVFCAVCVSCGPTWTNNCATKATYFNASNVYVCFEVSPEQAPAVYSALEVWNRALRNWRVFVPVSGADTSCTYFVREVVNPDASSKSLGKASMIGGREVYLYRGKYEIDAANVFAHEFGHALGAQHVPSTLMNSTYDPHGYKCPDVTTVAQIAAFNGLNVSDLCWCYY